MWGRGRWAFPSPSGPCCCRGGRRWPAPWGSRCWPGWSGERSPCGGAPPAARGSGSEERFARSSFGSSTPHPWGAASWTGMRSAARAGALCGCAGPTVATPVAAPPGSSPAGGWAPWIAGSSRCAGCASSTPSGADGERCAIGSRRVPPRCSAIARRSSRRSSPAGAPSSTPPCASGSPPPGLRTSWRSAACTWGSSRLGWRWGSGCCVCRPARASWPERSPSSPMCGCSGFRRRRRAPPRCSRRRRRPGSDNAS